ncbi:MAG: hypothetical protein C0513_08390 [Isosphaera sp.]|nr:hypothetical protein [Isosphaera sp.]
MTARRARRQTRRNARLEVVVRVPEGADWVDVLGSGDRNLKLIREALGLRVSARQGLVRLAGDRSQVSAGQRVLERLSTASLEGRSAQYATRVAVLGLISEAIAEAGPKAVGPAVDLRSSDDGSAPGQLAEPGQVPRDDRSWGEALSVYAAGKPIRARTPNQRAYLEAIRDHDVVFGIGPAGTGKTYLAVAAAVQMLKLGVVRKVILARPAVEAGEKLGYLPGDLQAKVNPYLRPLLDALGDMIDYGTLHRFMSSDVIEVVPLAFMRGRTLNRAAIILDEAQNTTRGQMKMFLTRMGEQSKIVVTGDVTQIDLDDPTQSGLVDAARVLRRVPGLAMIQLTEADIVRHPMVQRIVEAYGAERPSPERPRRPRRAAPTADLPAAAHAPAAVHPAEDAA